MNDFKRANNHITHVQIVSEYEDKVRALERDNERLNAYRDRVENARYLVNIRIFSLRNSLKRKPNEIKQAQLGIMLRYSGGTEMTNILTLENPQELLRIKREYILQEIAVYGERERDNLNQAMQARKARKELENQLFEFDNTIEILEELV